MLSDRAQSGHADARRVIAELALQAADPLHSDGHVLHICSVAYTRAKRAGRDDVARMLLLGGPKTNPTAAESSRETKIPQTRSVSDARRPGVAIAIAWTAGFHDKDYRVIRISAQQPDGRRAGCGQDRRHATHCPDVLAEVAQHRRWASRYAVKKALSANPHTPVRRAQAAADVLLRQDLVAVAQAGSIPEEIRAQAAELLRRD